MLSEKDKALIIDALGENAVPFMADFGYATSVRLIASDLAAIINAARHQAQEEAKAVSVEGDKVTAAMTDAGVEALVAWEGNDDPYPTNAVEAIYRAMIAAAPQLPNQHTRDRIAELEEQVRSILAGIDLDECENNIGWWETSTGAEFGAGKLSEVLAAIRSALKDKEGAE